MTDNPRVYKMAGTVSIPVREVVYAYYEWDISEADLEAYGCKDIAEFTNKVRNGQVRIWDLDYTSIETEDSEVEQSYNDQAVGWDASTRKTYPAFNGDA